MVYDKVIKGKFIDIRSINLEDVEFSYNIRRDDRYKDYVGQQAESMEAQRNFISWQIQQPGDYYFVVMNKSGERIGLIGAYNIDGEMAELGREVSYGNPMETMEAQVMIEDFCRDVLHLKKLFSVVYLNNKKVIRSQKKKGFEPLRIIDRNGVLCAYYEMPLDINNSINKKARELLKVIEVN